MTAAAPRPPVLRAWWLAARPHTLGASLIPVVVGCAAARGGGDFRPGVAAACAGAAVLLQVAANLANDAFDFMHGVDTSERRGPVRVTQAGWIPAGTVLRAAIGCVLAAGSLGFYLISVGGWPILAVGVLAIATALAYSGGPLPLASHGLGEIAAFVFFGVVAVTGTSYLQSDQVSLRALLASLAPAALVSNLMIVNNLRDIASDEACGKATLAVRIGAAGTHTLYRTLLGLAYASPALLLWLAPSSPWVLVPWLSVPLAWRLQREVARADTTQAFDGALAHTARLHAVVGLLLAAGLVA